MAGMSDEPVPVDEQITPRKARKSRTPDPLPELPEPGQHEVIDPFEGPTTRVEGVHGLFGVAQLRDEIASAARLDPEKVQVALVLEHPEQEASEANPATFFVSPDVDEAVVRKVLEAHELDANYGRSDAELVWLEVKEKVRAGEKLTEEEMAAALRMLAERF